MDAARLGERAVGLDDRLDDLAPLPVDLVLLDREVPAARRVVVPLGELDERGDAELARFDTYCRRRKAGAELACARTRRSPVVAAAALVRSRGSTRASLDAQSACERSSRVARTGAVVCEECKGGSA